jgi:LmbE family N-acetylglucosaminyl deacetylase
VADKVLVVAPHPDDETIGCGGTICLHRQKGDDVGVVFLTSGEACTSLKRQRRATQDPDRIRALREAEAKRACQLLSAMPVGFLRLPDLGLTVHIELAASKLRSVIEESAPTLIYLPHPGESHPDHEVTLPIVRAALAAIRGSLAPGLRGYEVWSPLPRCDWVEDISDVMACKLRAIRCYESQLRRFRYDWAIRGLNCYRGILGARSRYAEAFIHLEPRDTG